MTSDGRELRAVDAAHGERLVHRHTVSHAAVHDPSTSLVNAVRHQHQRPRHRGRVHRILNVGRRRCPRGVWRRRGGVVQSHVMHRLNYHMDRCASGKAGGVAFVIGPQNHHIIAGGQPCVRGVRPVAHHHPVSKVPTRGADPPANHGLKTDTQPDGHIGGGSQHGGAQGPGYRPAPILVAADGRRIGPRLAVYINPGSQAVTALAKAG